MNFLNRAKNPFFWIGLLGVVFTAAGINIESLTSWGVLFQNILAILENPFLLVSVIAAVLGVFVDTSTPGLTDSPSIEEDDIKEFL